MWMFPWQLRFSQTKWNEGFAYSGEIRGFQHVWAGENLFLHIGFGNRCKKTDVRLSGKHRKMLTSERRQLEVWPFFFCMFELENQNPNKVFFTTHGCVFGVFTLSWTQRSSIEMWVEAVAITATFGFQADGKPQQETIGKSRSQQTCWCCVRGKVAWLVRGFLRGTVFESLCLLRS